MSTLTKDNIDFIIDVINNSKIKSGEMKDDLIDHFCCAVEHDMKKGLSFKQSYDKAYQNICPDGFDEIHRETVYLLTSKKNKVMKRLLYLSGYLSAIGITMVVYMKLTHTIGAAYVLLFTAALLSFLFLPTLFFTLYRNELNKTIGNKFKYLFGLIGTAMFCISVLFKIQHWPGATVLLLTSIVIINFVFFPLLFFKMYRKSVE